MKNFINVFVLVYFMIQKNYTFQSTTLTLRSLLEMKINK